MVICQDLINFFESIAPLRHAEHWDNVGLMVGNVNKEINRTLLCLDVTPPVIEEAIKLKVDMIISHHPLLFKPIYNIVENERKGSCLYKLIKEDICVYSAHTNLDVVNDGVNKKLADSLDLLRISKLKGNEPYLNKDAYFGLGAVGYLKSPMGFDEFVKHVKKKLGVKHLRVVGQVKGLISKVAVFCGSFDNDIDSIKEMEADILIAGDLKYHTAIEALGMEICIVDAGHFNTEKIILPYLALIITDEFPETEVICNKVEVDPFKTY